MFHALEIKNLRRFRVDDVKITDDDSNISKFFGDWYLARTYPAASDRFHIPAWRESVHNLLNKLDTIIRSAANPTKRGWWVIWLRSSG